MFTFPFSAAETAFTKTEQKIIDFICQNPNTFLSTPITKLGERLSVSDATLSRFAKHCGFHDYKELKIAIASELEGSSPADKLNTVLNDQSSSKLHSFLQLQQGYIQKTMDLIEEVAFEEAATKLALADQIYIHAKGAAKCLGDLLYFRLNRFGKQIHMLPSSGSELFEGISNIPKDSVVVCFGFQKLPCEVQVLLKHSAQAGYQTILFSSRIYSSDTEKADVNLYIYRGEPEEYHSMTAPIAVMDSLILSIAAIIGEDCVEQLDKLHNLGVQYASLIPR